ncbi:MAG: AAA family ATPase [Phycisphaerae bacterium]|nr:AAA family ATPase [Phycisphaerae bacterium]
MIIVVTGMVGIDKKNYLEKVCEYAAGKGTQIALCNVGDMMYAESPDIQKGRILDIPIKRLHGLRRSIFKDIIAKSKQAKNLIVNTHATFRWRHGLFPAVDFDQMRELNADVYVCMVDGVVALHKRLTDEHTTEHVLKDLIVWREEEIISTEMLCKGINDKVPFYCMARGLEEETVEAFYRLIFEPKRKKAYLSFPMTHVTDAPKVNAEIQKFRQELKKHFTCFDPGDIEEANLPYLAHKAAEDGLYRVDAEFGGETVKLDLMQVQQIERDINSQTYARDFMLIDQANMIVSFVPVFEDGRAAISSGVERELQHAHEAAKEVYVIWPSQRAPSVFVTQTATKVFRDISEAVKYISNR